MGSDRWRSGGRDYGSRLVIAPEKLVDQLLKRQSKGEDSGVEIRQWSQREPLRAKDPGIIPVDQMW